MLRKCTAVSRTRLRNLLFWNMGGCGVERMHGSLTNEIYLPPILELGGCSVERLHGSLTNELDKPPK